MGWGRGWSACGEMPRGPSLGGCLYRLSSELDTLASEQGDNTTPGAAPRWPALLPDAVQQCPSRAALLRGPPLCREAAFSSTGACGFRLENTGSRSSVCKEPLSEVRLRGHRPLCEFLGGLHSVRICPARSPHGGDGRRAPRSWPPAPGPAPECSGPPGPTDQRRSSWRKGVHMLALSGRAGPSIPVPPSSLNPHSSIPVPQAGCGTGPSKTPGGRDSPQPHPMCAGPAHPEPGNKQRSFTP